MHHGMVKPRCIPCSIAAMQRAACRSGHMLCFSCRSQNAGDAGKSWQGTPAVEEPPTRRGSTEAAVPEYRASPTEASERDFASTTRGDAPVLSQQAHFCMHISVALSTA